MWGRPYSGCLVLPVAAGLGSKHAWLVEVRALHIAKVSVMKRVPCCGQSPRRLEDSTGLWNNLNTFCTHG